MARKPLSVQIRVHDFDGVRYVAVADLIEMTLNEREKISDPGSQALLTGLMTGFTEMLGWEIKETKGKG